MVRNGRFCLFGFRILPSCSSKFLNAQSFRLILMFFLSDAKKSPCFANINLRGGLSTQSHLRSADPEGVIKKRWCHSVKTRISCQYSLRKHPERMWNVTTTKINSKLDFLKEHYYYSLCFIEGGTWPCKIAGGGHDIFKIFNFQIEFKENLDTIQNLSHFHHINVVKIYGFWIHWVSKSIPNFKKKEKDFEN